MTVNLQKNQTKRYLLYLLLILILVDILDQYSTNYITVITSAVIDQFLPGFSPEQGEAIFAVCAGIATIGMYFVFLNQFFCDKFGRKMILVFTTLGMGVASLLLFLSFNILSFTIFLLVVYAFFSSDIWLIYINEEAPPEKRASWTNLVLAVGIIGAILMPVFRSIFITDTSPLGSWKGMTLFPIIFGIPLAIVILFTIKETSKYEEIKDETESSKKESIFLKDNIKAIFSSPQKNQFKIVLLMSFLNGLNYLFTITGEQFISAHSTIPTKSINTIIYIIAISVVLGYVSTGILSDKIGRKPMLYFHSALLPIAVITGVVGVGLSSFILTSIGFALTYIAFWGNTVVLRIVSIELVSTDKRGTASGLRGLFWAFGSTFGLFLSFPLILLWGLGVTLIIYSIPVLLNIFLNFRYIKETKGVNLSKIE